MCQLLVCSFEASGVLVTEVRPLENLLRASIALGINAEDTEGVAFFVHERSNYKIIFFSSATTLHSMYKYQEL